MDSYFNILYHASILGDKKLMMDVLRSYHNIVSPRVERLMVTYFNLCTMEDLISIQDFLNDLQRSFYSNNLGEFYFLISSVIRQKNTRQSTKRVASRPSKVCGIDSPLPEDPIRDYIDKVIDAISVSYSLAVEYLKDYEMYSSHSQRIKEALESYPRDRLLTLEDELEHILKNEKNALPSGVFDMYLTVHVLILINTEPKKFGLCL